MKEEISGERNRGKNNYLELSVFTSSGEGEGVVPLLLKTEPRPLCPETSALTDLPTYKWRESINPAG